MTRKLNDKDVEDMIQRCIEEISLLRHEISILSPKAHAYDQITTILRLLPQPSQGYGEDIVWRLKKQLADLKTESAAKPA